MICLPLRNARNNESSGPTIPPRPSSLRVDDRLVEVNVKVVHVPILGPRVGPPHVPLLHSHTHTQARDITRCGQIRLLVLEITLSRRPLRLDIVKCCKPTPGSDTVRKREDPGTHIHAVSHLALNTRQYTCARLTRGRRNCAWMSRVTFLIKDKIKKYCISTRVTRKRVLYHISKKFRTLRARFNNVIATN